MVPRRKYPSALNYPSFVLSPLWVCLRKFPHIFSLCLASLFPVFSWTPPCSGYFALFCLLLMCSNNVCRQASLLSLSGICFIRSLSCFHILSLSQLATILPSRTPQTFAFASSIAYTFF